MKRIAAMLLAFAMVFGLVGTAAPADAAERHPSEYVYTDYGRGYHLVSFLNGYNVIAFGNAHSELHMMGAMLVQGSYTGAELNSGFADGDHLPPSFVKGLINAPQSVYNSRNHNDVAPLYVGAANTVTTWEENGRTKYSVNGVRTGNDSTTPVYVNDAFFNFREAYEVIKADQAAMYSRATVVTPVDEVITVHVGDNVLIESLDGVKRINIIGDLNATMNTTINVGESGEVTVPRELINGAQPQVLEQNEAGTAIVFNFPYADAVVLPTQNWIGHVIAPDADVSQASGNFNGTIICDDLYTAAEGHIYSYNTQDTSWDTVFSLEKVWHDHSDADGLRPDAIRVQLLADGEAVETVTLRAADGWYYVWPTLPERNEQGDVIRYSVKELDVPQGYTAEYDADAQRLINTHEHETVDIRGTKTWVGDEAVGSEYRPATLTVHLHADGEHIAAQTITVTADNIQYYEFNDLPRNKGGKPIVYTIHEDPVPHYLGTTNGYDLTNTYNVESVSLSGVKTWNDDMDRDGLRPTAITVELLANGQVTQEQVVTAASGWTYSFSNLPKVDTNDREITYTVREKNVPQGYRATVNGTDIVNDHTIETVDLSGKKIWEDDNDNDGKRPASISVVLLANQQPVKRVEVTEQDGWAWSFTDLPKNEGGREIKYTVRETVTDEDGNELPWTKDYVSTNAGMDIINTHENETVDVAGAKTWNDDDNNDGMRPESITIRLLQDGKQLDAVTVTEKDGWAWAFTDLPRYTGGKEHVYTIAEDAVPGYTAAVDGYDVTNTHESETIDLLGLKVWDDADDQDGKRPARLTVYLLADGERTGDSRTTTADRNWYWIFEELPRYAEGREIVYTFEEEAVPGYTGPVTAQMSTLPQGYGDIGYQLTNAYKPEEVEISGQKTWNDENDQDGKRPDSITIRLWKTVGDQHKEVASKAVTEKDGWQWNFGKLPKYEGGKLITYTITEDAVAGYSTIITGYDVENAYTPGKVSISGVKHWNDADNQDGKRPESITVYLNKTVGGVTTSHVASKVVTPDAQGNWSWSFINLDEYEHGELIEYTIEELKVPEYTAVVDQYDLINTHVPETVELSGLKVWADNDDQDGIRPASVTIRLMKTVAGKTTEDRFAVVTAANSWKWHFVDLPKYENGQLITYTITEDAVPGYTAEITGADGRYTVTNTHKPETVEISGAKTWNDADDQDGVRPESITIRLLQDGAEYAVRTVTEKDGWQWTFAELPRFTAGKEHVYTITEDAVAAYTTTVSGSNVINDHITETVEVSGHKVWQDDGNRDGKRPVSITITLLANGKPVDSKTVTAANGWMWTFTDLPRFEKGEEIVYTITETPVTGYTAEIEGYIVTNTYTPEITAVSGRKIWNDADNQDGVRPDSVVIELLADGKPTGQTATVNAVSDWAYAFNRLPKFRDGGTAIVYTVREQAVPAGYAASVNGYDVTNTYQPRTVDVLGLKVWDDSNDQDGKRPDRLTVYLTKNGERTGDTRTTTADRNWYWLFQELPVYENGKAIVWGFEEEAVPGYTGPVTEQMTALPEGYGDIGYQLTNAYEPELVEISGSKTWDDADNQDGKRPESITVTLRKTVTGADGKVISADVETKTVTEADGWAWRFGKLPKYEGGREIIYTVVEAPVALYTTVTSGYDVINTYSPEETAISGEKHWHDHEDQDGLRPDAIEVRLYKTVNGQKALVETKTVTAADGWAWRFTGLDVYEDGELIAYAIEEAPVPGYETVVDQYDLINVHEPETVEVAGVKTWEDNNNQDGKRPASITVNLLKSVDGGEFTVDRSSQVTAANSWKWHFVNLPKYEGGKLITYKVEEVVPAGYTAVYTENGITNTYEPETTSVSGVKTWHDNNNQDGKRPDAITVRLLKNGVDTGKTATASETNGWKYTFADLARYENGKEITYTVEEVVPEGYTVAYSGNDITNTYAPEKTSVTGLKTWADNDDQDGLRPDSITVKLLKNGADTGKTAEATAASGWRYTFAELDKYEGGQEIVYTVEEIVPAGYTASYSGTDITNTHVPGETEVSGGKTWKDNNDQDGKRPDSITIHLLKNGVRLDSVTVTAQEDWKWTFAGLPTHENGKEIVYTIAEDAVPGYSTAVDGYNVTNTMTEYATLAVYGTKHWQDGNNADGIRPAAEVGITVSLLADGQAVKTIEVFPDEAGSWTFDFGDLPRYRDGGEEIVYTVTEGKLVNGYEPQVAMMSLEDELQISLTNTYEYKTVDIAGEKVWDDNNNNDRLRPNAVTINLLADGVEVLEQQVTAANRWRFAFTDLPMNRYDWAQGKSVEIVYTITEDPVRGYDAPVITGSGTQVVVTNARKDETVEVAGEKTWVDDNDKYGLRPDSITIRLYADGVELTDRALKVTGADGWKWRFTELPKFRNGRLISYTISEDKVPEYGTLVKGYDVENTLGTTSFSVTKVWEGKNGGAVNLTLYADGSVMSPQPAPVREGDVYTWKDLPLYNAKGELALYSVREQSMTGYQTSYRNPMPYAEVTDQAYNGGQIINSELVSLMVQKVWKGLPEGQEKPEIELTLYCNGEATEIPQPKPDSDGWYHYTGLPAVVNGKTAVYTVKEALVDGFITTYAAADGSAADAAPNGGSIVNTWIPETGDSAQLALWAALALISACGVLMIRRRSA
ncbi:MAG: Cna B-type domain-containing protein [Clostridia bacterium]|nr:Cna B-type domain-containing protein [Clostridia bacterium]